MLSNTNRAQRMRLLLAFAAGTLAIASIMTGAMSLALFTDQQQVNNNFTAGTIKLNAGGVASLALSSGNMMPGDTKNSSAVVQNDGSAQLRYSVSATSTNPDTQDLRGVLTLVVKTVGSGCGAFDGSQLYSGTLGASTAIIGNPTPGFDTGDRNLNATSSELLCFRVTFPDAPNNNNYQGASTVTTFTFDAEQTANNP